jgi:DNA-directed RNA polymerase specialized sigma24 family protein
MSEDERLGDEHGQDELIAAFAALGGRLTGNEFMRLLDSGAYYGTLVRLAALLLDGDSAAAEEVTRDSLAALQQAWSRLGDPEKARVYLHQSVVNRARSVHRHRVIGDGDTPQAALDAPGAGRAAVGDLGREPWVCALRVLPARQREAVVLHNYLGLSGKQAAEIMRISAGAARAHLTRGMSSLRRLPRPE